MSEELLPWLGDLYRIGMLSEHMVGVICIAVSGLCGAIVGFEREKRAKPAGLRTLILISVGSTIFTTASILIARDQGAGDDSILRLDRGRIAAQIVTGIGFLGAGAIIRGRRSVVGLTTGATIWTVAAIGVVVGIGYAAAGIVLSFLIFIILTMVKVWERWMVGPCRFGVVRVVYQQQSGKMRHRLLGILDDNRVPASRYRFHEPALDAEELEGSQLLDVKYCRRHAYHRSFLPEIATLDEVRSIEEVESLEGNQNR